MAFATQAPVRIEAAPVPAGPSESADAVAAYYDALDTYDGLYADPVSRAEDATVGAMVAHALHLKPGSLVLDLGCGTGFGHTILPGVRYVGVDISRTMLAGAGADPATSSLLLADFEKLSFLDESLDAVVSFYGSLSHARCPERLIERVYDWLRPGGQFFLMFYSRYSMRNLFDAACHMNRDFIKPFRPYSIRNCGATCPPPLNAHFFSATDLHWLFADFEDVRVSGLNAFWELPGLKGVLRSARIVAKPAVRGEAGVLHGPLANLGFSLIATGRKP
jgi:SAM-dependent methyltransferase